jgi:hypothetical protein
MHPARVPEQPRLRLVTDEILMREQKELRKQAIAELKALCKPGRVRGIGGKPFKRLSTVDIVRARDALKQAMEAQRQQARKVRRPEWVGVHEVVDTFDSMRGTRFSRMEAHG